MSTDWIRVKRIFRKYGWRFFPPKEYYVDKGELWKIIFKPSFPQADLQIWLRQKGYYLKLTWKLPDGTRVETCLLNSIPLDGLLVFTTVCLL